jgi:hypothetical protein
MENKELKQITNQLNKKAINGSAKKRNYLIATVITVLIIGIFAYQYYEKQKRINETADLLVQVINEQEYNKYIKSGMSKESLGDYVGAIKDYNKAKNTEIENESNYFSAYQLSGFSKTLLKDYKGAIIEFNGAIQIDSAVSDSYKYRGLCKFRINDKNGACLDLYKAQELGDTEVQEYINKLCN